ncbi:MAG: hypothetical protein WCJ56_10665 [bacterium]
MHLNMFGEAWNGVKDDPRLAGGRLSLFIPLNHVSELAQYRLLMLFYRYLYDFSNKELLYNSTLHV